MTLREFIKEYKQTIDQVATSQGAPKPSNNAEREDWVRNDEYLYNLARSKIKGFE